VWLRQGRVYAKPDWPPAPGHGHGPASNSSRISLPPSPSPNSYTAVAAPGIIRQRRVVTAHRRGDVVGDADVQGCEDLVAMGMYCVPLVSRIVSVKPA